MPRWAAVTVNLTRIYTKLGDSGETHLGDMSRVSKLDPRVEAYGTVDELNATLGFALVQPAMPARVASWLARVQNDLLDLGADLSVPGPPPPDSADGGVRPGADRAKGREAGSLTEAGDRPRLRVTDKYTAWLEAVCDEVNAELPPLRSFVIPGGNAASAQLHICRTVCRRAERRAIAVGPAGNPEVVRYLNRLSDMLFILARSGNTDPAGNEPLWDPGAHAAGGAGHDR
ncbi:MAG TPA: cob(I)yrinic acid a,c-diamide adenosyltransferase [Solirubrobacteraceae bacterium]|nr:cob(I)yrinic acid a,c-diamide adenosyltransferase [Solirubrobacteraceae bacterium]